MTIGCVLAMLGFAMYRCVGGVGWGGGGGGEGGGTQRWCVCWRGLELPFPFLPAHTHPLPCHPLPTLRRHHHSHGKIQKFRDSTVALQPRVISLTATGGQAASGELQPLKLQDSGSGALHRVASNSSAASEKV